MAHFAKIENDIVTNCIFIRNEDIGGGNFPESESVGQDFIAALGFDGEWLQTSYNKNFRGQFAGIGMSYNTSLDCFHGPSPYPSWNLESSGLWSAPVAKPEGKYYWDEDLGNWVEIVE